jgi:transposase
MDNELIGNNLSLVPTGTQEGDMIVQTQWGAIRALADRGLSRRAIARHLDLDIKTVRKWLSQDWSPQHRQPPPRRLDRFNDFILKRAPEVAFNGAVLLRELREQGYTGSYQALARRLAQPRAQWRQALLPTLRFETEPGQQAQVDWGSLGVWLGEQLCRCHFFVMVLGYSRRIFAKAYSNERLAALLDGHSSAFAHFGGRPREILYDNPRTIVLRKDEANEVIEWNRTFKDRMDFYGLEIRLCRFYRAQTKGKIESGIKYVKRNALAGRRFRDLEDLNDWLTRWCVEIADLRIHGTTHERPVDRFARAESAALIDVSSRSEPVFERMVTRLVPRDAYVVIETNRYPVPVEWVGQAVEVHLQASQVQISCSQASPVTHTRLEGKYEVAHWQGEARSFNRKAMEASAGPPRFDPNYIALAGEVEQRCLAEYAALEEEVVR